jgi:hypothetical protein
LLTFILSQKKLIIKMAGAKKDTRKASEMETKPAAKASKKQKVVEPVVEVLND